MLLGKTFPPDGRTARSIASTQEKSLSRDPPPEPPENLRLGALSFTLGPENHYLTLHILNRAPDPKFFESQLLSVRLKTSQQMIAATRSTFLMATTLVVVLTTGAHAQLIRYQAALRSLANGAATFRSVEALPAVGREVAARAFAAGSYSRQFRIGTDARTVVSQNGEDGILVAIEQDTDTKNWETEWILTVDCPEGNAIINDIAIRPDGRLVVGGTFFNLASLQQTQQQPIALTGNGQTSFLALAEPTGEWLAARSIPGMELRALAIDDEGSVFVTGPGILARRYDAGFQEIWNIPEPADGLSSEYIAVGNGRTQPFVYVQGTFGQGANDQDVFVTQLGKEAGNRLWNIEIRSNDTPTPGQEQAGGIGVGPQGVVRAAVSSDGSDLTSGGVLLRDTPTTASRHGHLLFLDPTEGRLRNDRLLGASTELGGVMDTYNLDIDYAGNTYVAIGFTGSYSFKGAIQQGEEDAAVVVVDSLGIPMRFLDSNGNANATGFDVAAAGRDLQLLVGRVQGTTDELFGVRPVAPSVERKAYLAVLDPPADQQSYIINLPDPDQEVSAVVQSINQLEGEVYRVINNPDRNLRLISADLTTEQAGELAQAGISLEVDRELVPNGQVGDPTGGAPAGWALETLNNAFGPASGTYCYPETCRQTVLYLIDTGIDTSSGYFDGNPNLEISESIVVRATGDPLDPLSGYDPMIFEHGTEMLSMIAGPDYGAALGTPIKVVNYNIYPDGNTTTISALIEAVSRANTHKSLNHSYDPATFCIASSSNTPGSSPAGLESAIDYTLTNVYATVLVSAGNNSNNSAADYTPSDLGVTRKGVICVGATNPANGRVPNTRTDPDLWAPGLNVEAADINGNLTTMTGTSASTALATGAALIYLSLNPVLTPADAETALDLSAQVAGGKRIVFVPDPSAPGAAEALNYMDYASWAFWYGLDSSDGIAPNGMDTDQDGDGWSDKEEYFFLGSDPNLAGIPRTQNLTMVASSQSSASFEFSLSCLLYQNSTLSAPYRLRDGTTLSIRKSSDLQTWVDCTDEVQNLQKTGEEGSAVMIRFDSDIDPLVKTRCFYQILVHP